MRILFLLTIIFIEQSLFAQSRSDTGRRYVSLKEFDPGSDVVVIATPAAYLYFSQEDFFGCTRFDTLIFDLNRTNEYASGELLRQGRGRVYDRNEHRFADSISYYTNQYGLQSFYLPGEKQLFWIMAFIRTASFAHDKTGTDHVIRREMRTFPGQFLKNKPGICDSAYNSF
ncbi:MAG TPA: hypothetical protein VHM26_15435 [Chitinophagaceae bacterium]|nr:hypothetical protein [Chitinophagaceae bacterium]